MTTDTSLWRSGWLTLAIAVVCLIGSQVDERQVGGVNTWIKPLKFALSVGIYFLSLALILPLLDVPEWRRRVLAYGIPFFMGGAFALVVMQGARGVQSHFNQRTAFDGIVFGGMGLLIMTNTLLLVVMMFDAFRAGELSPALLWGIRLGLLSAVVGSLQGGAMIQRMAHTIGAPDGGPGLPLLNFSTIAGDLRISHALALHGLQILPLAGWWISRAQVPRGSLLVWILFGAIMGLTALTWLQALSGKPLLARYQPNNETSTHDSPAGRIGASRQ